MSKPTRDDPSAAPEPSEAAEGARAPGPELRLVDRKAFVGLGSFEIAPGIRIADLALQIPNVSFPFNVSGGAAKYQKQRCHFGQLDLEIAPQRVKAAEEQLLANGPELARLHLHLRAGFIEAEGALRAGGKEPVPFTCRIAFDGAGDGVAARAFDVRLYGACELPAPLVAGVLAKAAARAQLAPGLEPRGFGAVAASPLADLLRRTVPQRGFRLPEMTAARLGSALVSPQGITLRFSAGAPPPGGLADEELLLAVEGAHAFEEGERHLESGQLQRAREFFLRAGELAQAHPFATERLISLLLGDRDVADYALDLVRALAARRPLAPAPLWMEALLRLARGERQLATQRYLDLAALARGRGEEASAFWAAQAASRIAGEVRDDPKLASLAVRALHESLGLRPDHFPSLQALAEQAERAGDDAAALRAYRRLTAVAREASVAARAHVRLGELSARVESDFAGARLHYDAALRLLPDDPEALLGLADLCARSGEPLRALRSLDRVRELHPRGGQLAGRAELEAGAVYEHALNQLENARLRYLEAARALPGDVEPLIRLGRVAERLGRVPEAVEVLTQALELLGSKPSHLAHEAHRMLARIARDRLHDGARQREHLESAVRLRADDAEAWEELIPLYRADEAHTALAEALARAAPRAPEIRQRVALLVESAELLRLRLGKPEEARARYQEALALEPRAKAALEGILALDELFGDMGPACEHLRVLLELSPPGPARLPLLRRLVAAARDGKKDLDLAARATRELLALAPDDHSALAELVTLQRRRGDLPALADALEGWARSCERQGDAASTAAALRELAGLYEARLGRRDDALSALEKAHALAPQDAGVLADLADLALRAGRHRLARHATRALLNLLPAEGQKDAPPASRRAELHERLARASEALGDLSEAAAALEESYRLVPDEAYAERLDALYTLARRDDARIDLARRRGAALAHAGLGAQAARVLSQGAALARALGDLPAALREFTAALAADPSGQGAPAVLEALAELCISAGQPGEAAGHLARRAGLESDRRAAARLLLRAAQLCLGVDEPRALSLLAAAAGRDAAYAPARAALAERRARSGDLAAAWREAEGALEVEPTDADALDASAQATLERAAARWAEQANDLAAAARLWGRYLQRRPEDLDALQARVGLLRKLGDPAALAAALETLEQRSTGEASLRLARELAHLYEHALARVDLAAGAHRRVLRSSPEDREALAALARLLTAPSEVDERVDVLGRLAALARTGEEAAQLQLQRGEALRAAMRFADAARAFAEAARTAPDPQPALELLVAAAEEAGQAQVGLDARRELAELAARRNDPSAGEALLDVAGRLAAAESWDAANTCLQRALELAPAPALARAVRSRLAELARARGALGDVLTHSLELAKLVDGAERLQALRSAADAATALEDLPSARDALLRALALAPRDAGLARVLADVQRRLGDVEGEVESLALLAKLEAEPAAAAELWMRAAALLREAGHAARAEASLRHALELQPKRADARAALLELVLARGEFREAAQLHEETASHETDSIAAARALLRAAALNEAQLDDRRTALRLTRAALQRAPELPEAIAALAERSYLAGAGAEAAPLIARTLELIDGRAEPDRWIFLALALAELRVEQGEPALGATVLRAAAELAPWRVDVARALFVAQRAVDPRAALERLTGALRGLHASSAAHALQLDAAQAALSLGERTQAAALLEEALTSAGDDRAAIEEQLIALHLELGHPHAAVALLRTQAERLRAAADERGTLAPLSRAAQLLEDAGDAAAAVELWARVVEVQLAHGQTLAAAGALLRRATLLRGGLGRLEAAEQELRRAIELDPRGLDALRMAEEVAHARGDARAEAEFLTVAHDRLDDGSERARVLLRRAALERGPLQDASRAVVTLRSALALDPLLAEARDLYEDLLREAGRKPELAHSLVARASSAAPGSAVAYLREAAEFFGASELADLAADALDQARALAPNDEGLALAAADALARAGRSEEAALVDAALLARDPSREPSFSRELARRAAAGDLRGQAALFQARALSESPELGAPRFLEAGRLFEQAGDLEAARRCELWAFERAPQDEAAFARVVARHQGERHLRVLDGVLRRRAQAVEAEAAELHLRRARLLAEHDELDDACAALDDALAQGIDGPPARDALILRADLEARLHGAAAAARFDERLASRDDLAAPERLRILSRLADTRAAAGRDADAAALWQAALTGAPQAAALALYEKLSDVYARLGDNQRQAEVLLARAQLAPGERAGLLRAAAELAPDDALARRALAALAEVGADAASLLKLARLELAAGDARGPERLVEAARAAVVPSVQAGLLLEASQLFEGERARELRAEARRLDPGHLEVLRAVAVDLRRGGPWAERRDVLTALVEQEPAQHARLQLRRELVELLVERDAEAAHHQLLAWAQLADAAERVEVWSRVEALARKFESAPRLASALEQLAALEPADGAARLMEAAAAWQRANELGRARAALSRAAAADATSARPLEMLAELARRSGEQLELAHAEEALAERLQAAARAEALVRAAGAWSAGSRPEAALRALRAAAALLPERLDLQLKLADAALALEQSEVAQDALLAASKLAAAAEAPALLRRAAQVAESRGDAAVAERCWRAVWEIDPRDAVAFDRLSQLIAARQDRAALAALLEERAKAAPADGAPWGAAARAWEDAGQPGPALAAWLAAQRARPDDVETARAVLDAAESADDGDAIIDALRALGALEQEPAAKARAYGRLAALLRRRGQSEEALTALRAAADAEPEVLPRVEQLVDALEAAGQLAEAAQRLGRVTDAPRALARRRADLLERTGELRGAAAVHLDLLTASPGDADSSSALRRILGALETPARAELLERWAGIAPESSRAGLLLELASLVQGDARRSALERAFAADPALDQAFSQLRDLLVELDADAELAQLLERRAAAVADPGERSHLLMELGELYEGALESLPEAFDAYERSLQANPANASVLRDLAELAFDLGRDPRARELYEQLLESGPASLRALFHERLATLAIRADDAVAAVRHLEATIAIAPTIELRRELRARAEQSGDAAALMRALGSLAEHTADDAERAAALRELAALEREAGGSGVALEHVAMLVKLLPEDLEAWRALHELARDQQDQVRELLAVERLAALEREPHARAMMLLERARILGDRGEHAAAARSALAAHVLTPGDELALREALEQGRIAKDAEVLATAGRALLELAGEDAVAPFAREVGEALADAGEVAPAYRLLTVARRGQPADRALAERLVELASKAGDTRAELELGRGLIAGDASAEATRRLRSLAGRAERELGDIALAAELFDELFARESPDDASLTAHAERLTRLARSSDAALARAELARRDPGQRDRWAALAAAAHEARLEPLIRAADALDAFLAGALPEEPSAIQLAPEVRAELLAAIPEAARKRLAAEGQARWAALPLPAAGLRPGGPVLLSRIAGLAQALGAPAPSVRMDPGSAGVQHAGPDVLVVGIGLFSLPPRVQDYVLALAIARAMLGVAFDAALPEGREVPSREALEAAAEALAAAVVGDGLGALVGCTAADASFAQSDPRAWDRALALEGPARRGAAAAIAAALAQVRSAR